MSIMVRRIILLSLGLLAGLAVWPAAEVVLVNQVNFPSYLMFNIFQGAVFGLIFGLFFGCGEGIISGVKFRIITGLVTGALIGILGGAIGFLIGQGALFFIGGMFINPYKNLNLIGLPLSRAIGWAVLGLFIGSVEGIRARSMKKIVMGILGGLTGGLLGGFVLEYLKYLNTQVFRLVGLLVFGLFIGLFYGIIEKSLSLGILRVLNGKLRGKEYLINQNSMKIGKSKNNDICLAQYEGMDNNQAQLKVKKNDVILYNRSKKARILVNDEPVTEKRLKYEDVIKIGTAKFFFKYQ